MRIKIGGGGRDYATLRKGGVVIEMIFFTEHMSLF
jgi:hypothetical protein